MHDRNPTKVKVPYHYVADCIPDALCGTVPTCKPSTKCVGIPGIIHDCTPEAVHGMDAWMTSRLNVAFINKLRGSLVRLAYFFDM